MQLECFTGNRVSLRARPAGIVLPAPVEVSIVQPTSKRPPVENPLLRCRQGDIPYSCTACMPAEGGLCGYPGNTG